MTFPFRFEYEDDKGEMHDVEGRLEYDIQDNSFSYDYGEQTNLTHDPGPSVEIGEVTIESVTTEILMNPPDEELVCQAVADYYGYDGESEVLDYDKELSEDI